MGFSFTTVVQISTFLLHIKPFPSDEEEPDNLQSVKLGALMQMSMMLVLESEDRSGFKLKIQPV